MELFRRQFIELMTKVGGASLFSNVSLGLVSSPVVDPEEYLSQASATLDACWELLSHSSFDKVERALNTHVPTLTRFANAISPFQDMAAGLVAQAKFMQIILAGHRLDFVGREIHCVNAVRYGELSHALVVARR
jgi:hypothetical protein